MYETKPVYLSKGCIGGAVATLAGVIGIAGGYHVDQGTQTEIANSVNDLVMMTTSVASVAGGLLSILGRVMATKRIK